MRSLFIVLRVFILLNLCNILWGQDNLGLFAESGIANGRGDGESNNHPAWHINVTDESGEPLDNVFVVVGERVLTTDEEGLVTITDEKTVFLQLAGKDYPVSFHRTGYRKREVTVSYLLENRYLVMQRKAIEVYGVTVRANRNYMGDRSIIKVTPEMSGKNLPDIISNYGELTGLKLAGERQTMSLGGHHSRHLMVMLDGIPLNKMGQPVDLSSIPAAKIESVEIIRGGSSGQGGAGAIAGIINIITRQDSANDEYYIAQGIGSFGYKKSSISIAKGLERLWFDFYGEFGSARNDFEYVKNDEQVRREFNDKAFRNLYLKTVYRYNRGMIAHKIDYHGFQNKMPGPVNYLSFFEDASLEGYGINNDLQIRFFGENLSIESTVYHKADKAEYDNTASRHPLYRTEGIHRDTKRGGMLSFFYSNTLDLESLAKNGTSQEGSSEGMISYASLNKQPVNYHKELTFEYNREDFRYDEPTNPRNSIRPVYSENFALKMESGAVIPVNKPHLSSVPKGRNKLLGEWHNNAAIRYDLTNLWDDNYSWRYVTSFHLDYPDLLIGFSASRNFSLPSFYDLYWKGDCQAAGNPDLLPEESDNYRFFGEFVRNGLSLRASYEKSEIDNLIYWFRSVTGWKPGNISSAMISDFSAGIDVNSFKRVAMSFSYSAVQALNKTRNQDGTPSGLYNKKIMYRPEKRLSGQVQTHITDYLAVTLAHSYTGEQHTTPDQLIPPLPGYHLTDLEIGLNSVIKIVDYLISLSLNNIFDNRYEIYAYTPQPGFNWMLNLRVGYSR